MGAGRRVGSQLTCRPSRWEAGEPVAAVFPPDSGCRKGRKWPWQAGSVPDHQGRGQQEPPTKTTEGARTKSIQMKEKESRGSSRCSCPSVPGEVRGASPPSSGGWHQRRPGEATRPHGGLVLASKSASLAHPPGRPPPPCPSGLPVWAWSQRSWSERAGVGREP